MTFDKTLKYNKTIIVHIRTIDEFIRIIDFLYERGYRWNGRKGLVDINKHYERYNEFASDTAVEYDKTSKTIRFGSFSKAMIRCPLFSYVFDYDDILWESEPSVNFEDIY